VQFVAITAVGQDRPGIVAEFSGVLYRFGCNLEESTMTRLRDEFAMLLLVRLPEGSALTALQATLESTAGQMGLSVGVRPLDPQERAPAPGTDADAYILRVYGADRPGIVHRVATLLAEGGWNITDLNSRLIRGAGGPVYMMLLEVDSPRAGAAQHLKGELGRLKQELDVEITFGVVEREAL
jgi:glycine cleavage system transcriptional repressor